MPSVPIADDHATIRRGLRHCLEQERSMEPIGEAATGAETLRLLRETECVPTQLPSPVLSLLARPGDGHIATRRIAILVGCRCGR